MRRSLLAASAALMWVASGCAVEGEEAELPANGEEQGEPPEQREPHAEVDATSEALSLPWGWWYRRDAGARDASAPDAGFADAQSGAADAAAQDAAYGGQDAGNTVRDASAVEAGAATSDAALRDAQVGDAAARDAATPSADAGAPVGAARSVGCGRAESGNDAFDRRTKNVNGTPRTYHVRVPASYSKDRAYPLVFRFHGSGGNGLSGGLDIQHASAANAIVVGADGLNSGWTGGSEANDLALFDAMLDELSQQYCIDLGRVFAYGFSAGGGMTNALGCKRAAKIRGTAAIAGFDRGDASCDAAAVAAWFRHDVTDPAVLISQGRAARDRALRRNGCTTQTSATTNGCVSYVGCKSGAPVIWCETNGLGHDIAGGTAPAQVWEFFSKLP